MTEPATAAALPLGSVVATEQHHHTVLRENGVRYWFQRRNPKAPGTETLAIVRRTDEEIQALLDSGEGAIHRIGPL